MDYHEIVKKLVGRIDPIGESNTDEKRFENLKQMTALVNKLIQDIDSVGYDNKDSKEFSLVEAEKLAQVLFDKCSYTSEAFRKNVIEYTEKLILKNRE